MIIWTKTADSTVGNTVTETTILDSGQGVKILNPNFFTVGKVLTFIFRGYYTTTATPTLRFRFKLGSSAIIDTQATTMTTEGGERAWIFTGIIICRGTGVSGSISLGGNINYGTATAGTWGWDNNQSATVDTTAAQTMDITAQWGTAHATNTLKSLTGMIEVVNK